MENLKSVFVEEATALLDDLEAALLKLEKNHQHKEGISEVFRTMHSLKGTSSMFGYEPISNLTHGLETVYQSIRDGELSLTPEIFNTTLHCLDHLRNVLGDSMLEDPEVARTQQRLLAEIAQLGHGLNNPIAQPVSSERSLQTFHILFNPQPGILKVGTNTLYLIDDLLSLGTGISLPFMSGIPELRELDAETSYLSFEVLLCTDRTEDDIRELFIFVDNDSEIAITKLGDSDLLSEQVRAKIAELHSLDRPLGYPRIKTILLNETLAITDAVTSIVKSKAASSVRVSSERLDELMNLVSELVTTQASLTLLAGNETSAGIKSIAENIEKITRRLRDNAFTMTLVPVESLVVRFQRLIRDVSENLGKEVVFKTEGTDTEIDKSIIEKLLDPLLHLLRNALDHGIETVDTRLDNGKPRQGTILFRSYYEGSNVLIQVKDDGAGMNLMKIKQKAVEKGLIQADAQLTEKEITDLIFLPGFSTAEEVTDVSGRGVGMDVVRRNIADIRGEIDVHTERGKGSTFTIRLPLTLSIIDGLRVKIGDTDFIVPLSAVNKCYEVETDQLESTFNSWITLDGNRVPFFFLRKEFAIDQDRPKHSQVIKVSYQGNFIGLVVDKVVGNYQAVLKPLSYIYKNQDEYLGATILGDGTVALVIDSTKLIHKLTTAFNERINTNELYELSA